MAKDKRRKRMRKIAKELFDIANSFADDETGNAATFIHESVNNIWTAEKCLNGEDIPIPIDFFFRSMGIDMGKMMENVADITNIAREDSGTD